MCVHACTLTCMQCQGSQNRVFVGCQSPGSCSHRQLGATMWGLGIEFKSPGRVESALSIEPSLQAPSTVFSKTIIYFSYCNCNRIGNIHFMIKRLMQKYSLVCPKCSGSNCCPVCSWSSLSQRKGELKCLLFHRNQSYLCWREG